MVHELPATHRGMTPVPPSAPTVAKLERVPSYLFHVPYVLAWIARALRYRSLTLPTAANPTMEAGGLWGESKGRLLDQLDPAHERFVAAFTSVLVNGRPDEDLQAASAAMEARGLGWPVVAKPDVGWQGYGVRLVENAHELETYLGAFPAGERVLLQRPVGHDGEAGVFYVRWPGAARGQVIGMGYRYFPHVVGDGRTPLDELIRRNHRAGFKSAFHFGQHRLHHGLSLAQLAGVPALGEVVRLSFIGSLRVGGLYRDANADVTPELSRRFDDFATGMDHFYIGRFDIRFASEGALRHGEDFQIIEINGAGAVPTQAWDPEHTALETYRVLLGVQDILFRIAASNRDRGWRPMGLRALIRWTLNYNRLLERYPPSS